MAFLAQAQWVCVATPTRGARHHLVREGRQVSCLPAAPRGTSPFRCRACPTGFLVGWSQERVAVKISLSLQPLGAGAGGGSLAWLLLKYFSRVVSDSSPSDHPISEVLADSFEDCQTCTLSRALTIIIDRAHSDSVSPLALSGLALAFTCGFVAGRASLGRSGYSIRNPVLRVR